MCSDGMLQGRQHVDSQKAVVSAPQWWAFSVQARAPQYAKLLMASCSLQALPCGADERHQLEHAASTILTDLAAQLQLNVRREDIMELQSGS